MVSRGMGPAATTVPTMLRLIQTTLRIALSFLTAATLLPPTIARAARSNPSVVVHRPEDFQTTVMLGPLDPRATSSERSAVVRFPRSVTLYRFRAELIDAEGKAIGNAVPWGITFVTAAPMAESYMEAPAMARLSNGWADLSVPRPYGVHLAVGDSILILAALPTEGAPGATLRITLDYEASPASRLPAMVLASQETVATGAWTWRAEVTGRLVAIDGRQLAGAAELILEDATTGRVVWQMRVQYPSGNVAELRREAVRPGVMVQEGRLYRLRIRHEAQAKSEQRYGGDTPFAIVAPKRDAVAGR